MIALNSLAKDVQKLFEKKLVFDTEELMKWTSSQLMETMQALTNWTNGSGEEELKELKEMFAKDLADVIMTLLVITVKERIDIEDVLLKQYADKRKASRKKKSAYIGV